MTVSLFSLLLDAVCSSLTIVLARYGVYTLLSFLPLVIEPDHYLDNVKKKMIKMIKNKDNLI